MYIHSLLLLRKNKNNNFDNDLFSAYNAEKSGFIGIDCLFTIEKNNSFRVRNNLIFCQIIKLRAEMPQGMFAIVYHYTHLPSNLIVSCSLRYKLNDP